MKRKTLTTVSFPKKQSNLFLRHCGIATSQKTLLAMTATRQSRKAIKKHQAHMTLLTCFLILSLSLSTAFAFPNEQSKISRPRKDPTPIFTNNLEEMRENCKFGVEEFETMREALLETTPSLINPMTKDRSLLSIKCRAYWKNFEKNIEKAKNIHAELNYDEILTKVDQLIFEIKDNDYKREEACIKTENIELEMDFAVIPQRKHKSKFIDDFEIIDEIEIQTTPVTQYQWAKVMGNNPSHFKTGEDSRQVEIDGKKIEMIPNRPVENASYEDIIKFINILNEQDEVYEYSLPSLEEYLAVTNPSLQTRGSDCLNKQETCHVEFSSYTYLGNKRIYSMLDNILEFTRDKLQSEYLPPTNKILFGKRYSSVKDAANKLTDITRSVHCLKTSNDYIGFRLVRHKKGTVSFASKSYDLIRKEDIVSNKNYIWDKIFQHYINKAEHLEWMFEHKDQYPEATQHTLDVLLKKGSAKELKNLTKLYLNYNKITDITPLAGLTNLTELHLYDNEITDLTPLAGLTNLTELHLYDNEITDLNPLAGLINLGRLHLHNNEITDLTPLAGLTNLTELALNTNKITDLTPLAGLTNLEWLVLQNNKITDLNPLAGLINLGRLHLHNNEIADLTPLTGLTNLTWLQLYNNKITDLTPLAGLKNLTDLGLNNNKIINLTPLAGLTNLTRLELAYNKITDLTPLAGLTNLGRLHLHNNEITDLTPLAGLTNLTEPVLNTNKITDLTPLAGLTNLTDLYLENNEITDLTPLAGLTNLTYLYLENNEITDLTPLAGLINLTDLYLSNNKITDLTPLAGLTNLWYLHIKHNPITDYNPLEELERNGCRIYK